MALINDMITAINKAEPKLEKAKFVSPTKLDVIFKIAALMTKLNKPKVISVIGNENKCKIGLTIMFRIDNTKLATIAMTKLLT